MAKIEMNLSPEEVQEILIAHIREEFSLKGRYPIVFQWTTGNGVHVSADTDSKAKHDGSDRPNSFHDFLHTQPAIDED